jgi:hypothetical protein
MVINQNLKIKMQNDNVKFKMFRFFGFSTAFDRYRIRSLVDDLAVGAAIFEF